MTDKTDSMNTDLKGRCPADEMTDREIAEETLETLRKLDDIITGVISGMERNPMFKMMGSKMGLM